MYLCIIYTIYSITVLSHNLCNIISSRSGKNQTDTIFIMIWYEVGTTIGNRVPHANRRNPKTSRSHYFRDTYYYYTHVAVQPTAKRHLPKFNIKLFWLLYFMITVAIHYIIITIIKLLLSVSSHLLLVSWTKLGR